LLASLAVVETALQSSSQEIEPTSDRVKQQNRLFEEQFEADMKASPETATAYGRYEYNALLDSRSLVAARKQNDSDVDFRTRLSRISTEGFPEQDRISHDLLMQVLDQRITDYSLKSYEMPLSQMQGVHNDLADLPKSVPLDSVKQYEDYIHRLTQIPRAFAETIEVLRRGEKDGLMPPRRLLDQVPSQCRGVIAENPFVEPIRRFPTSISPRDQRRLRKAVVSTVNRDVLPAYQRFARFVEREYAPHGRASIGMLDLPDGLKRYQTEIWEQTSTDMSPDEIQQLGLREVARISALMAALTHESGFADIKSYRASLAKDPNLIPASPNQIVDDFRRYIAQMQPRLGQLFNRIPTTPLTVEAIPDSQPGNASHYVPGPPDGTRPGRVVVATANFRGRSLIGDETLAYHEGVPGHHMQISIQQQLPDMPEFRHHLINNAFAEGWAVYAEGLGKEIGFFQNPASDFGRLSTEMIRAVRLVIDPGIHAKGWTREQAVQYFRDSGAADESTIQAEVDRYIAWPAQSLGYKIGQLKIRGLRERATATLGPRFDLRSFHDEVLSGGNLPLNMLEARVENWTRAMALE
jgi:uncharacterized protein (DUF885 family)